jgi:hypothetical protein
MTTRNAILGAVVVVVALAAGGVGGYVLGRTHGTAPALTTEYHAVLLNNGSVYFGKLEGLGSPNPVLRSVYYVQSSVYPQTKAVNSVLVKRGGEWHGPDRMILQASSIAFVEPVSAGSRVAQLIAESNRR